MQKKLIAAAVAGVLAAPVAVAEVAVSGSIRTGVEYTGSEWNVRNVGSRLRFKANSDLGNGQSVFATYEFGVNSAQGTIGGGKTNRLTVVGMKGDWGQLSLGSQWSTLFNTVGTFMDPSYIYGGYGYNNQYRMADSVYVSTQLGGLSLSGDAQMSKGGDDLDRATLGGLMSIGGLSLGAAWQDNGDDDFTGVGGSMDIAGIGLAGGFVDQNTSGSGYNINGKIGSLRVSYDDHDSMADGRIWGNYTLKLGGGASAAVEIFNDGTDTGGTGFLRMNF